jgi:hypothetical protein
MIASRLRRAVELGPREVAARVARRVWPFSAITRVYYTVRYSEPVWRRVLNRRSVAAFVRDGSALDSNAREAADSLARSGLWVGDLARLAPGRSFSPLRERALRLLSEPEIRAQVENRRSTVGGKAYVVRGFATTGVPRLDVEDPLIALALDPGIVGVVNDYLGLYCRLKWFDLWYNLPVSEDAPASGSMRWHRDYDDRKLVKLFVLLDDVDETMGPLEYVAGSNPGGVHSDVVPARPPQGAVPPSGAVERAVPAEAFRKCTGPAGTLVLCDTRGLHRGGRSSTRPRLLFTATYASEAAVDPDRYELLDPVTYRGLGPAVAWAIGMRGAA